MTDDAFREGGGSELLELPPVEMSTLPLIAKVRSNESELLIYFIFSFGCVFCVKVQRCDVVCCTYIRM